MRIPLIFLVSLLSVSAGWAESKYAHYFPLPDGRTRKDLCEVFPDSFMCEDWHVTHQVVVARMVKEHEAPTTVYPYGVNDVPDISTTVYVNDGDPLPAHRLNRKPIARKTVDGQIQIELDKGKNTHVDIMSKEDAAELRDQLDKVLPVELYDGEIQKMIYFDDAKPAAR